MAGRPLPRSPGQEKTCGVTLPPDVSFGYFGSGGPGRRLAFYLFSKVKRFKRIRAGQRRVWVPLFESGPAGAGEPPENFCRHGRQYVPELTKGQARRVCPVALFVREAED